MIDTCSDCGQVDCECHYSGPRVLAYIFAAFWIAIAIVGIVAIGLL